MSLLSWFYGGDALQKQGEALDAQIVQNAQERYGPGSPNYNAGQWAAIEQNLASGATGNVEAQLNDAFMSGIEDGKNNITGAVSGSFDFVGGGLGSVLKGIPWYVWAGVLVFFFWPYIAGRLVKR